MAWWKIPDSGKCQFQASREGVRPEVMDRSDGYGFVSSRPRLKSLPFYVLAVWLWGSH